MEDWLDEGVFEASFVFVFWQEEFLLCPELGNFFKGGVGGGAELLPLGFEVKTLLEPMIGEEIRVSDCAELEG